MPDFSKTRLCKNFSSGLCELGSECSFAHSQQELVKAKKLNKKWKEEDKLSLMPRASCLDEASTTTYMSDGEASNAQSNGSVTSCSDASLTGEALLFEMAPLIWQKSRLDPTGNYLIISV
mmetsp:Transcript_8555/g.20328  ORF Transcript_8555/g.20328 Transcript_8555/m.20328 type:complete len:120 (+) Transcript_8555:112-471(+)